MIDFLIIVMYIIMSIALLAITCSVAKRLFLMKQSSGTENRIPKRKIRVTGILSMLAQTGVVAVTVAIACILISAIMRVYNNK